MRAAVYKGVGRPLSIEELPEPAPGPDDLIIRVERSGICATDLTMTSHTMFDRLVGRVFGHEYSGEIAAIGSSVTDFEVGDRVTALASRGCGHCEACRRGNVILCPHLGGELGGFGEYARAPSQFSLKLPDTLSAADAALIEPLAVSLWGVRTATIQPGERVLVIGGGPVALATIYWARRLGAVRVVAVSRSQRRAELAVAIGADAFVRSGADEVGQVTEALGGAPDIVFDCIGVPGVLGRAIDHCAQFGRVVSLGFSTSSDSLVPATASRKALTLKFALGYSMTDFEYVSETMHAGHVDPKMMISSVISLDELPAKFEELRGPNRDTKVHVSFRAGDFDS